MNHYTTLEFDIILTQLAGCAVSENVKQRCHSLLPAKNLPDAERRLSETTQAKQILTQTGTPPLASMTELGKIIALLGADAMLVPEQLNHVLAFITACRRMVTYMQKAQYIDVDVAFYGASFVELSHVEEEIVRCIRGTSVDDRASHRLYELRRGIENKGEQIKARLEQMLRKNKDIFSEGFLAVRAGRFTLPVKREFKGKIDGVLVELSNTGGTCFIEPASVRRIQDEMNEMRIEEDNEVRRILFTLTAIVYDNLSAVRLNIEAMETLDFLFAKAKLSVDMDASPVKLINGKEMRVLSARHPLLKKETAVHLDFALGKDWSGIVITGPNTGGKTVALKTMGLLSLMAQSGLHVPADERSVLCMFDAVLCDVGDGQSISENLSTFSSHMTNIIGILNTAGENSLVLLDELGSGTDPAEGMGIAMAILEALLAKNCLFTVTTHYPEIKDFAAHTAGLINARMAFDKESLMPLYKLEIGEAGESCALYIAERLGMPVYLLERAREITYSGVTKTVRTTGENIQPVNALIIKEKIIEPVPIPRSQRFNIGDSVTVYPKKEIGIVYARADNKGEVGVQVKGIKRLVNHKRLKLKAAASELYPDDYDMSIVFDTVANRKARKVMEKRHEEGNVIVF